VIDDENKNTLNNRDSKTLQNDTDDLGFVENWLLADMKPKKQKKKKSYKNPIKTDSPRLSL